LVKILAVTSLSLNLNVTVMHMCILLLEKDDSCMSCSTSIELNLCWFK